MTFVTIAYSQQDRRDFIVKVSSVLEGGEYSHHYSCATLSLLVSSQAEDPESSGVEEEVCFISFENFIRFVACMTGV